MTEVSFQARVVRRARVAMFAAALAATGLAPAAAHAQPVVAIADGSIEGQLNDGTREFLGIPYAAPPVGPLRFKPPQDPAPWAMPLVATSYPPACSQLPTLTNSNVRVENEDCLYLNVWSPDPLPAEPLPVMFWIHGGSNTSGSTADGVPFPGYDGVHLYDGHFMSKHGNVIVVTVNYRLNVFGFFGLAQLATEDPLYPHGGNQGLLDQRKAMQWVHDNIAAFGGDPNNVTIYGESAGSFDVCAHVASPMSAGLFQRAISESGGCSVGVNSQVDAEAAADVLTEAVGCDMAPDKLACLRALPTATLLDAGPLVSLVGEGTNLGLSVDGGFLPEAPRATFDRGARLDDTPLPPIPYILGSNGDEGTLFFIGFPDIDETQYQAELLTRYGSHAAEVEAVYPASDYSSPRDALIRLTGDATLVCSTHDVARRYSTNTKAKTYLYNFARIPPLDFISLLDLGAFHGLELGYVFGAATAPTTIDVALGSHIQDYWSSFATKGKPKSKGAKGWPRFKAKSYKGIRFGSEITTFKGYNQAKCDFWSALYDTGEF